MFVIIVAIIVAIVLQMLPCIVVICVNVHLIFIEIMFSLLVSAQINQIAHETFEHEYFFFLKLWKKNQFFFFFFLYLSQKS